MKKIFEEDHRFKNFAASSADPQAVKCMEGLMESRKLKLFRKPLEDRITKRIKTNPLDKFGIVARKKKNKQFKPTKDGSIKIDL